MSTLTPRRPPTAQEKGKEREHDDHDHHGHEHSHSHENGHSHSHSHAPSIFGLGHSHAHGEEGHGADAERMVQALRGQGDRGSRITLIGLVANVGLTASKGAAGWYMNSASLLADAGHSLSDLLGDFVTLFCWKLSRRPPSETYPYGFGKFEVVGTAVISILLTAGAVGIGMHSWSLLADALSHSASELSPGPLHDFLTSALNVMHAVPAMASEHAHSHSHGLDPNAAWFAALGVVSKEWLYRVTKRVADEEHSPVLLANAIHHRSDAYSSVVALVAILGSWWFPHLPLDPIGGLLVSIIIMRQGWGILLGALRQLTDASVSPRTKRVLTDALRPLVDSKAERLLAVRDVRAMRAGALMFVDLTAHVPSGLSVGEATSIEDRIRDVLKKARKEVSEVRVKFHAVDE